MASNVPSYPPRPSRFVRLPLRIVKVLQKGINLAPAPWYEIRLTKGDFRELRGRISLDEALDAFVEESVRYDYSAHQEILTFRRPNPFQNSVVVKLVAVIENLLCLKAALNTPTGAFARLLRVEVAPVIYFHGSPTDYNCHDFLRRHPDAAFRHADARFPGVIIEITNRDTYLGKRGCMWSLAREYIFHSRGDVRAVVSLEIDSKNSISSISMWKPKLVRCTNGMRLISQVTTMDCVVFRDEYGQCSLFPGSDLTFSMRDFADESLTADLPNDQIVVSALTLTRLLNQAEEEEFNRVEALEDRLNYPRHLAPWSRATLALPCPPRNVPSKESTEDDGDEEN